jgi:hypothetical protein
MYVHKKKLILRFQYLTAPDGSGGRPAAIQPEALRGSDEGSIEGEAERVLRSRNWGGQSDHPIEELDWLTNETGQ